MRFIQITGGVGSRQFLRMADVPRSAGKTTLAQHARHTRLTLLGGDNRVGTMANSVSKIQIGQLWKDDTGETSLRECISEALSTMATLRAGSRPRPWYE
jgi:hypothetical protein